VSRFGNDTLAYSQNQAGYTLPRLRGLRSQVYLNVNVTVDGNRQDWANFFETGPGVRFRWAGLPESLVFSVNVLRGSYLRKSENFNDVRAGLWYAFTH
jgi:hypothetical protein